MDIEEINKKFDKGEITHIQRTELLNEYYKSIKEDEVKFKKIRKLSDRQIQEEILYYLKFSNKKITSTNNWIVFWSWLSIVGLIIYIITIKRFF